jgi:hypothetical protein
LRDNLHDTETGIGLNTLTNRRKRRKENRSTSTFSWESSFFRGDDDLCFEPLSFVEREKFGCRQLWETGDNDKNNFKNDEYTLDVRCIYS